jgi:hypothetical protein
MSWNRSRRSRITGSAWTHKTETPWPLIIPHTDLDYMKQIPDTEKHEVATLNINHFKIGVFENIY